MVEIKENIINLIKEGYTLKQISEKLKQNYREILEQKKILLQEGALTKQHIQQGKDNKKRKELEAMPVVHTILNYKREGLSDNAISEMSDVKRVQSEVSRYVKECIRLGIITQKEIEEARIKKEKKDKEENPNRRIVLEGLRLGKSNNAISLSTTIGYEQVKKITLSLIEEGIITQEEIDIAREKAEAERRENKENTDSDNEVVDEKLLLIYLMQGYDTRAIMEKMGILDLDKYKLALEKLIEENQITKQEIDEYREKREIEEKTKVFEGLKAGMSQREIAKIIGSSLHRTQTYIKKIKEEKNITDEDILAWKQEQENSLDKKKAVALEGLKEGLTRNEIVEKYPKQELKASDVKNYRNIFIEQGIITQEEIEEYRELRKQKQKMEINTELTDDEKTLLRYLNIGLEASEIAALTHKSSNYTFVKISKIKEKGKITQKDIEKARMNRRIKDCENIREGKMSTIEEEKNGDKIKRLEQLKSEISFEVKLGRNISPEKKKKIREYIDLCYEIHKDNKITKLELLFLKEAIRRVQIDEKDIIRFVKQCTSIGEYEEALNIVVTRNQFKDATISKEKEEQFKKLETTLNKSLKVRKAIQIIRKGNVNTEVISEVTGLTHDEINILKIKISKRPVKFLSISKREEIMKVLKKRDLHNIQKELGITDFETEDLKDQFKYRRLKPEERDFEAQIKQDSKIRIIVLFTKLGKSPDNLANIFKIELKTVEKYLNSALEVGLIKENELKGINPLENTIPNYKELEL